MNVFALQGLFGGVKAEQDTAAPAQLVSRSGSAQAADQADGAELDGEGFAALLQLAVEQQPEEQHPVERNWVGLERAVQGHDDADLGEGDVAPETPSTRTESDAHARDLGRSAPVEQAPAPAQKLTEAPMQTSPQTLTADPAPGPTLEEPPPTLASRPNVGRDEPTFVSTTAKKDAAAPEAVLPAEASAPAPPAPTPTERSAPDRDLRRLDPRLRVAVRRVLRRLDKEFGIDAKVAEGYRTEERQKTLFAQGRTTPGNVVTWTLDSAHTRGRAVDLMLNGQWTDLEPYRVLQMVAQEEGLQTLGMKDPGHLQLPASAKPMRIARVEPDALVPG
ncbi:MAG: hypothetical protein ACR2QM_00455, partial [Longimicrobiales bacterium]